MNSDITKEWLEKRAALEGDSEISAGIPTYVPPFIPSDADRYYSAVIGQYQSAIDAHLQRIAELESDNAKAFDALKGLVHLIDAVKYQVGLGNNQLKRLNSAKALLDARAALQGGGNG